MAENQRDQTQGENGNIVEIDGVFLPTLFAKGVGRPLEEHIPRVRNMQMRDDDVIICAYAKAGTHWLWEVGMMLLAGEAKYETRSKEHVMMEATDVDIMDQMPSPRLLNTHFPIKMLPNQVKDGSKKVKVIHVYRNPKDTLVSMWYHVAQEDMLPENADINYLLELFLSPKCLMGNYVTYMKDMDVFFKENANIPILRLSFEEMKGAPVLTVKKLAEFLGVQASDQLIQEIVDACSFHRMKDADKSKSLPEGFKGGRAVQMYRKGVVGDWKNELTVAQSERIDAAMTDLDNYDYHFQYTL